MKMAQPARLWLEKAIFASARMVLQEVLASQVRYILISVIHV